MTFLQLADAGRMREDITKELKTGGASVYGVLAGRKAKEAEVASSRPTAANTAVKVAGLPDAWLRSRRYLHLTGTGSLSFSVAG